MLSLASTVFSRVFPELESRILIRTCQKLDDPSVKSILPRIMESWIAVISLVSDLTLAVSWVGTVSVPCSIRLVSAPRPGRPESLLAVHHWARARVGRTQNVGCAPARTAHPYLSLLALRWVGGTELSGTGCLLALAVLCTVYSPPLYCASLNTSSRHGYYQH